MCVQSQPGCYSRSDDTGSLGVAMVPQVFALASPEEIAREAERIYEGLDEEVTAGHEGEFMVVSLRTRKVYISPSSAEAFRIGREAEPHGLFHLIRIGANSAFKVGVSARQHDGWAWPVRRAG